MVFATIIPSIVIARKMDGTLSIDCRCVGGAVIVEKQECIELKNFLIAHPISRIIEPK
jgi:hypothetical protein